jgi:hypothetical protein
MKNLKQIKMKLSGIIGVSFLVILFSCSHQNNSSKENEIGNEKVSTTVNFPDSSLNHFIKEFSNFYYAFKNKEHKTLNNYIDPDHGFVIIYSEGAMPQVSSTDNLTSFTTSSDKQIYDLIDFPDIALKNEDLPRVDCNSNFFYDKSGSYFSYENPTAQQEMWIYGNFNENEKDYFKKVASTLTFNVVITGHGRYGVEFKNNKLKVIFIDIRKPCNA